MGHVADVGVMVLRAAMAGDASLVVFGLRVAVWDLSHGTRPKEKKMK